MAFNFDDEVKAVRYYKESIPFGVSKVQFTGAIADVTEAGKDFVEVGVVNADGIEDTARLWFVSTQSGNISFNTARQIAVHNSKTEDDKAKTRDRIDACKNPDELVEVLNDVCVSGELWFTKYYDPSRTYEAADGSVRKSVNKNVYGYEPKEKPELMPNKESADDRDERKANAAAVGGTDITGTDAAANVPDNWS